MRNVCLIPARSGSKGLKDKNMAFLNNKPVLQYTIDAALESGLFVAEDIYLSTDSSEYIDNLGEREITALYRDPKLSSDYATTTDVVIDFLSRFDEELNLVLLQPTSPLRTAIHIKEAFELYRLNNRDKVVVSVSEVDKSPSLMTEFGPNNELKDLVGIDQGYRRQNFEALYAPNGAIFITGKSNYLEDNSFFTKNTIGYQMDKRSSIDIDDYDDFVKAIGAIFFDYRRREGINYPGYVQRFKAMLESATQTKKIILGDSRTEPLMIDGYLNLSMGGVTTVTVLELVSKYLENNQVEEVIINLGVNDIIVGYDQSQRYEAMSLLISAFKSADIKVCNVFPTIYRPNINNEQIVQLNEYLSTIANISLIETYDRFEKNGKLDFSLTRDGLHLNAIGDEILKRLIIDNIN